MFEPVRSRAFRQEPASAKSLPIGSITGCSRKAALIFSSP
jgi:hypothetical protein